MKKHFDVFINGNKIKILNYRIKDAEGEKSIVFKTLIKGQNFVIDPEIPTEIIINGEIVAVDARFECALRLNSSEEWIYNI